ncbi:IQ calmodulin-binding motif family protein [Trichomonas vaginalis G3]|uniref:IQ calmodulin-binding motif family protein n=1 Tax=Trichomonas vaginalis (strain ATCC PRA-98 / G3) TaxID=412133 RepID=A2G827_TRIV3|nr:hypothetical protein TVAGG3_0863030 [Trichomonas vaginalis G3]EAX86693.1 IQ calmodulin-binding motif family protein [Trichomonas vaginalis G3]KAI5500815.1 hypothetical protein TVAGG3_0863030 [Trichomonas vaginalis G3]|eukprot:XP_001299623.1 IQ calmodulin-binding motif family protein [Trichomonas vaginalis G3]
MSQEELKMSVNKFVRGFVLDQTQDVQALIIQRAYRMYRQKMHYKRFIQLILKNKKRMKQLFFTGWKLALDNEPAKQRKVYKEALPILRLHPWVQRTRTLSPYPVFYLTGQIYIFRPFTPEQIYAFVHLMYSYSKHRCLRLWHITASGRVKHRMSLSFIRFSTKKAAAFGVVYRAFLLWYRFIKWNAIYSQQTIDTKMFINVPCNDVLPRWDVIQESYNSKIRLQQRAKSAFLLALKKKTLRALYNKSLANAANQQVIYNADVFYQQNLLKTGHRAWLKYIEEKQRDRQMAAKAFNAWYEIAYDKAHEKTRIQFFHDREIKFFSHRILNRWIHISGAAKLKDELIVTRIQEKPRIAMRIIFPLMKLDILAFNIRCFEQWIKYTRRRRLWRRFVMWSNEQKELSEKNSKIIAALKKVANMHKIGALSSSDSILPYRIGICPELTFSAINSIQNEIIEMDENHEAAVALPAKTNFDLNAFLRTVIILVDEKKDFAISYKKVPPKEVFERFRTHQELRDAISSNSLILKENVKQKLTRDRAIITAIKCHENAIELHKMEPDFNISKEPIYDLVPMNLKLNENPLKIYPEYKVSFNQLIRQMEMAPPRLISTFKTEMKSAFTNFDKHMRSPTKINNLNGGKSQNTLAGIFGGFVNSMVATKNAINHEIKNNRIQSSLTKHNIVKQGSFKGPNGEIPHCLFNYERICSFAKNYKMNELFISTSKFINSLCAVTVPPFKDLSLPNMTLTEKRRYLRNKQLFIDETEFPEAADVALVLYKSLLTTKLSKYLEKHPFPEDIYQDDISLLDARYKLWAALIKKYQRFEVPQIGLPEGQIHLKSMMSGIGSFIGTMGKPTNGSMLSFNLEKKEDLTSTDGYIGILILPLVFTVDNVFTFVDEECN